LNILGLDIATNTGFCIGEAHRGERIWLSSGEVNFKPRRGEGKGMRFVRFRKWLREMLDDFQPDVVVYEQAHMRGGAATEALVGLTTLVIEMCDEWKIDYVSVHTGELKRFATGKGNSGKAEMVDAARAIVPTCEGDDEADAIHAFLWGAKEFS
jgi:Holliday junction resolvasome RuvABC endonuclease subunit